MPPVIRPNSTAPVAPAHSHGPTLNTPPTVEQIRTLGGVVAEGARGGSVSWMQDRLGIKADGRWNASTTTALKAFQQANGLTADGRMGKQTLLKLETKGKRIAEGPPRNFAEPPIKHFNKPAMTSLPSPNFDPRGGQKIDTIVIHDTSTPSRASAVNWMRTPGSNASAHFVVDRDGTILNLVPEDKSAYHAGQSYFQGKDDVNKRSLGIEIVNDGSGRQPFTQAQMKAVSNLVGYLREKHGVAMGNIVGHKTVAAPIGRKADPAPNFPWEQLRGALV